MNAPAIARHESIVSLVLPLAAVLPVSGSGAWTY